MSYVETSLLQCDAMERAALRAPRARVPRSLISADAAVRTPAVNSLADLHRFDTATLQWSPILFPAPPRGRMRHGFAALGGDADDPGALYAFGGYSCPAVCAGAPARPCLRSDLAAPRFAP